MVFSPFQKIPVTILKYMKVFSRTQTTEHLINKKLEGKMRESEMLKYTVTYINFSLFWILK